MFQNRCAKCHQGQIFHHFLLMNEHCPHCHHHFEREEGFFIGAMIISYFLSTLLALPILLVTVYRYDFEFMQACILAAVFMLITAPLIYRYSKIAWVHIEEQMYQAFKAKRDQTKL